MLQQSGTAHCDASRDDIVGLLRRTFGRSAMGVCYCDENRIIRWASRAFGDQLSVPPDPFVDRTCDLAMPGWSGEIAQLFDQVRNTGEGWHAPAQLRTFLDQPEHGTTLWSSSITPVIGDDGEFQGW